MESNERLDKELKLIAEKLQAVKESGFGEVRIQIADGVVVHITHSIGEQIKTK